MKITDKMKKESLRLTEEHNKLRWFCVNSDFECNGLVFKRGWYERVGTGLTKNNKTVHSIKPRGTKDYFVMSDLDYKKIITKFEYANKHLRKD